MGRTTRLLAAEFSAKPRRKIVLVVLLDIIFALLGLFFIVQYLKRPRTSDIPAPAQRLSGDQTGRHEVLEGEIAPTPPTDSSVRAARRAGIRHPESRSPKSMKKRIRTISTNESAQRSGPASRTDESTEAATNTSPTARAGSRREAGPETSSGVQSTRPAGNTEPDQSSARRSQARPVRDAGTRSEYAATLRRTFRRHRHQMKRCYQEVLTLHGRRLAGNVHLKFDLRADGVVAQVTVVQNTTGSIQLQRCLLALARKMRFPRPPMGATTFLYPIAFKAKP